MSLSLYLVRRGLVRVLHISHFLSQSRLTFTAGLLQYFMLLASTHIVHTAHTHTSLSLSLFPDGADDVKYVNA